MVVGLLATIDTESPAICDLFCHCSDGDLEGFETSYERLNQLHPSLNLIQPCTVLATVKQHFNIIEYGLKNGAMFDENMDRAIERSTFDATGMRVWNYEWTIPFLDLLYEHNWKGMKTSPSALEKLAQPRFSVEVLQWFIEHGARLGHDFAYNCRHQPAPKIKFVIEKSGFAVFRGTGVINYAAIAGEKDVIELLLDAGICVLDNDTIVDVREPGPYAILAEAVSHKHFEIAKMILERGSPIGDFVQKEAKAQGGKMEALINHHESLKDRKVHICTMETCGRLSGWNRKQ